MAGAGTRRAHPRGLLEVAEARRSGRVAAPAPAGRTSRRQAPASGAGSPGKSASRGRAASPPSRSLPGRPGADGAAPGASPAAAGSGGRWEKKKQVTREALLAAASTLFAEQGYAATTVQQITDAADVSERTFFRYFDSKEDLLLTDVTTVFSAAAQALAERPLDEEPLEAMYEAMRAAALRARGSTRGGMIEALRAGAELAPSGLVRLFIGWEEEITEILLQRVAAAGGDRRSPETQLRAAVTARAGIAALRATVRVLRTNTGARPASPQRLVEQLRLAYDIAAGGCASGGARSVSSVPAGSRRAARNGAAGH